MNDQTADGAAQTTTRSTRKRASTKTPTKTRTTKTASTRMASKKTATKTATKRTSARTGVAAKKVSSTRRRTSQAESSPVSPHHESESSAVATQVSTPARRAPTEQPPTATTLRDWLQRFPLSFYVTTITSLVLLIGGVGIGVSDAGQINVRTAAEQYNQNIIERQERGEEVTEQVIPVSDSESRANRPRLRPSTGAQAVTSDEPDTAGSATSTATTTDDVATTTPGMLDQESESDAGDTADEDDTAQTDDAAETGDTAAEEVE